MTTRTRGLAVSSKPPAAVRSDCETWSVPPCSASAGARELDVKARMAQCAASVQNCGCRVALHWLAHDVPASEVQETTRPSPYCHEESNGSPRGDWTLTCAVFLGTVVS